MLFVMLKNDFIIYKDPMNDLHAYLPLALSSCPGMTLDAKWEEGPGVQDLTS